jgi:deoxyhypusine synthase
MLYFQSYKRGGFHLDIVQDVRALNDIAVKAHASGMVSVRRSQRSNTRTHAHKESVCFGGRGRR